VVAAPAEPVVAAVTGAGPSQCLYCHENGQATHNMQGTDVKRLRNLKLTSGRRAAHSRWTLWDWGRESRPHPHCGRGS